MNATRTQHVIPAGIVLAVALVVAWLSFTEEPAEAFLFPRIISVAFVGLAAWNMYRAAAGLARVGGGIDGRTAMNVLPGLVVALAFVFVAATWLGFYVAGTLTFLTIYTIYDPAPLSSLNGWVRRIIVTALFMAVMYGLFALLLQVQTPRGMFF
jgi:hypothetical protein